MAGMAEAAALAEAVGTHCVASYGLLADDVGLLMQAESLPAVQPRTEPWPHIDTWTAAERDAAWQQDGYTRIVGDGSCFYPEDLRLAAAAASIRFGHVHSMNRAVDVAGDPTSYRAELLVWVTCLEGVAWQF